jgi:TatD DNase family protein
MIDSHCHLADEAFDSDRDDVIARARQAGLSGALCILSAGDEAEAARAGDVRARWTSVRFAAGVHPHNASRFADRPADAADATRAHLIRFDGCAVGEIGLDYHYDFSPPETQRQVFAAQLALARELDRPIIIHTREATEDTFSLLAAAGGPLRGVFHCFTGDDEMARRALDIGFHLSFAGIVSFPKAQALRDTARLVPQDRLLIETDSPYLAPVPHRGKRNEPSFVARVLAVVAEIRGEPPEVVEGYTTRNFEALFGPRKGPTSGTATA